MKGEKSLNAKKISKMCCRNAAFFLLFFCLIFSHAAAHAKKYKPNTPLKEYKYQQKVLRKFEKEKYKRSLLPKSGYMTTEEYEILSEDVPNEERKIPSYKAPKDVSMKYVPRPIYKLTRYNNPPGSVELRIERKFSSDRQVNGSSITSPNRDIMVYPTVYYYGYAGCVSGDLFVIPLDMSLPDVERLSRANIVKRNPEPILSTDKSVSERFVFRTMTPIDFSPDGSKLVAKEKIGYSFDGIWKTNLWVYDFNTKTAKMLPEVRDAIKFYWYNEKGLVLDEKRWDIYPLGFSSEDPNRIVVEAYGYTGKKPTFLGTWSVDTNGERSMLISLFDSDAKISVNGYKLVQDGIVNPAEVYADEKKDKKLSKKLKKKAKHDKKADKKLKKMAYKKTIKEMKKEERKSLKEYNSKQKISAPTGIE